MGKYHVHRNDENAEAIIGWLERHGASVARSGRPTDVIVGYRSLSALAEIKTLKGALRPSQKAFLGSWKGAAAVLRTTMDAKELLTWMEACASHVPISLLGHGAWMVAREWGGKR